MQKISVRISVDALKLCLYFIFIILLIELGMTGYKTFRALSLSVFSLIWMYHVLGETLKFSFLLCISSLLQKRCHQFGSYICIQIALLFNTAFLSALTHFFWCDEFSLTDIRLSPRSWYKIIQKYREER